MTEENRRYRSEKRPPSKAKSDRILNYLIGIVVVLIIVVAAFIFTNGSNPKKVAEEAPKEPVKEQVEQTKPKDEEDNKTEQEDKQEPVEITSIDSLKESNTVQVTKGTDQIVDEVLEDPNWQPYPTKQQDDGSGHTSSYDEKSVDWQEKLSAMAQITALEENDMIVWFIKNNGGPDTSIGTISSKDKTKKYRVSLKWENHKGWKPVKVELLKQINGAY